MQIQQGFTSTQAGCVNKSESVCGDETERGMCVWDVIIYVSVKVGCFKLHKYK